MTGIREVEGTSLRQALERARAAFGLGAVVIDQRRGKGGVRLAVSPDVPRSLAALDALKSEARRVLEPKPKGAPERRPRRESAKPGSDVERRLVATGVSRARIDAILAAVEARALEDPARHPLDLAADEIGAAFRVTRAARPAGTAVLPLVGRAGEGKTSAALALSLLLHRAGRRVQLARLSAGHGDGALAVEREAQELAERYGLTCVTVRDAAELSVRVAIERPDALVLDTTGRPEHDVDQVRRLTERLADAAPDARVDVQVVLAATRSRASQEEVLAAFAPITPTGVVLSKLDETRVPAPALEVVHDAGLAFSFLSKGADPERDLVRAAPGRFADLCLRGRTA